MLFKKFIKPVKKLNGTLEIYDKKEDKVLMSFTPKMINSEIVFEIVKSELISNYGERIIKAIYALNGNLKIYV